MYKYCADQERRLQSRKMALLLQFIVLLVGSACLATGRVMVINDAMDKALEAYAKRAIETGTNVVSLADFTLMGVSGEGVTAGDLSTTTRVGDALLVEVSPGEHIFAASTTIKVLWERVDNYTIAGYSFPAKFTMENSLYTMRARISRPKGSPCSTHWELYRADDFGKVTMMAPRPEFDGKDITDIWRKVVKPYINNLYSSEAYLEFLNKNVDLCIE
ncbi:hypothetical protein AAG570_005642 [Ranatra chinensis]|uniref:Uncharacterized protein n=1 Tax=Ranatra chinensis TaxID=642074 RepID=A0ABD0XY13_9HEMI